MSIGGRLRRVLQMALVCLACGGGVDPYAVLGVSRSASLDDMKKAYRRKSLETHPDKHGENERAYYEKKFKEVNAAWASIKDGSADEPGPAGSSSPYSSSSGDQQQQTPVIRVPLKVSMEQLLRGGSFSVPLVVPISSYTKIVFAVPAKFKTGACEGDVVSRRLTKELGEICVFLVLKPHRRFQKRGDVIYATKWLPAWAPSMRRKGWFKRVKVKGLDGQIKLNLPASIRDGLLLRAKGRGLVLKRRKKRGDLIVRLKIRKARTSLLRVASVVAPAFAFVHHVVLTNRRNLLQQSAEISLGATTTGGNDGKPLIGASSSNNEDAPVILRAVVRALAAVFFSEDLTKMAGTPSHLPQQQKAFF